MSRVCKFRLSHYLGDLMPLKLTDYITGAPSMRPPSYYSTRFSFTVMKSESVGWGSGGLLCWRYNHRTDRI